MSPRNIDTGARPLVFLGGIFTPRQIDFISRESKGVIQNAADGLQKKLIEGLFSTYPGPMTILNLPFVGSYPQLFRRPIFPCTEEIVYSKLIGQRFVNIRIVRSFSRLLSSFAGFFRASPSRECTIVVYSAHLPFLVAAVIYRALFRDSRICLVLPDLPEFMGEGGKLYRFAKSIDSWLFYRMARHVDGFVLLTRFMAERLNLRSEQFTVVEGIADALPDNNPDEIGTATDSLRVFLYTGTLAARYGIMNLVEAFRFVKHPHAQLWICGEGDCKERIMDAAKIDPRIRFLGQVSRDKARALQKDATILVNPRLPLGEFTRYSFPSKTMEYLASGRPVLMYHLAGIPDEYLPYFTQPPSADVAGLATAMKRLAGLDSNALRSMGASAREFVLKQKSPVVQCQKIVELIMSLR